MLASALQANDADWVSTLDIVRSTSSTLGSMALSSWETDIPGMNNRKTGSHGLQRTTLLI